jgi:hypothetical protein
MPEFLWCSNLEKPTSGLQNTFVLLLIYGFPFHSKFKFPYHNCCS